jgi:hypothetical protein
MGTLITSDIFTAIHKQDIMTTLCMIENEHILRPKVGSHYSIIHKNAN